MNPIPFNAQKDLAPVVFDAQTCHLANELKQLGVPDQVVANIWQSQAPPSAGEELRKIYELLIGVLKE
jgi:hypothetical protein